MGDRATIEVEGATELRATLAKAGADLDDFHDAHGKVAALVGRRAAQLAPKVSGALAASMSPTAENTAALIGFGVVYAGVIEGGWPRHNIAATRFATTAAQETEDAWLGIYAARVDDIVGSVKGT